jgi:hypothetical protein
MHLHRPVLPGTVVFAELERASGTERIMQGEIGRVNACAPEHSVGSYQMESALSMVFLQTTQRVIDTLAVCVVVGLFIFLMG